MKKKVQFLNPWCPLWLKMVVVSMWQNINQQPIYQSIHQLLDYIDKRKATYTTSSQFILPDKTTDYSLFDLSHNIYGWPLY